MLLRYPIFLLFAVLSGAATAQSCAYQLRMFDSFGDGWNGAELTLTVNGVATTYTVTNADNNGDFLFVSLPVTDGDVFQIGFQRGGFPNETSYEILDNDDFVVFADGPFPEEGDDIGGFTVACARCAAPPAASFEFFRVRSTTVDVRVGSVDPANNPIYRVYYGPPNFDPATDEPTGLVQGQDTVFRIEGLEPDSSYSFFFDVLCVAENDTTRSRGPYALRTPVRADVGVTAVRGLTDDCGLDGENVTIGITNFGGEPQAFFNVDYAINGQPAGVTTPADGIFTGVVGVDSTEFFTFDTRAFLGVPGDYELTLWTSLEGDANPNNDTLTFFVTSIPTVEEFPYVENFEEDNGGWYVDNQSTFAAASWEWGQPDNTLIDRAPQGRNAWVTGLNRNYVGGEESYLVTPCLDLSGMEDDPLISFQLFVESEDQFDGLAVEYTTDGGEVWRKIETNPSAINWYNDPINQQWTGDGGFGDEFVTVASLVSGVAGEPRVQLRFGLTGDLFGTREGFLIDAFTLTERGDRNLAAAQARSVNPNTCSSVTDSISFRFTNLGLEAATDFDLSYRVNDGEVVTETFPGTLDPGRSTTYIFGTPFDGTAQESRIEVWTSLTDDFQVNNDTTLFFLRTREDIPFIENFQTGEAPSGWDLGFDLFVRDRTGDGDVTLEDNVWSADTVMNFLTANYGTVEEGDSLLFDVTMTNFFGSEEYTEPTRIVVNGLLDCGADTVRVFETFSPGSNDFAVDLSDLAGRSVIFEFRLSWPGNGVDIWVQFDDIAVKRCSGSLDLTAEVVDATGNEDNGAVTVIPGSGVAPFRYAWPTGDSTAVVDSLAVGSYDVTVTDATGCSDVITAMVDLNTSVDAANEVLAGVTVSPNPTQGRVDVRADLGEATPLSAAVYDLTGRRLRTYDWGRQRRVSEQADLTGLPAGMYLLRLQAGRAARTVRVVKQ